MTSCMFCGSPIDPLARNTDRGIHGWERKVLRRQSGTKGGSDIHLRETVDGEYAHSWCVDREKAGLNALQETLL